MEVKAWQELVKIPTYKLGEADKNPMFLENRVYQGSSGSVYPHPVIDKVYDEKEEKEWNALFLENEYLKIMILPELGGRIQMAYDKTNDYHFIYHNSVIKPALVGLAGPWISGGIEFNWPQHHRPSTFEAVDYSIVTNEDGSKTVWVNEYEKMFRTKCALGFTLHPHKSYIELHAKILNRTNFPQTFLWWANPAVAVDEHYQSVFPPDVNAVFDHGKRDVSSFPIATGTYYKVDYSPGTDISIYTNIPVPTSYMAVNSEFDFVGGYHHVKRAGMLHVADHHISPGKKQWTWGCGEFGKAWDRQLTDNDGPYFELMCGMFTDNQPDFSWIMPNEVREFKQYFMPYKEVGYVKNASIEAAVNLEVKDQEVYIGVYLTETKKVTIQLLNGTAILHTETIELSPKLVYSKLIPLAFIAEELTNLKLQVCDESGALILAYSPVERKTDAVPDPAKPIAEPQLIETNEELYLAGLHLEQYRHATYKPEDYYLEAIKRDPADIRSNNAMGLLHLKKGLFNKSETYFRVALERLTKHNPNPFDGETLYNLALSLTYQKRYHEAYQYFFKSAWNAAMQDNAYYQLALLSCRKQDWNLALQHIDKSLARNYFNSKARHLKAFILRKLNQFDQCIEWIKASLSNDRFDYGSRFELYTVYLVSNNQSNAETTLSELVELMRNDSNSYIEISIDYANAGAYGDAGAILSMIEADCSDPLTFYYLGCYQLQNGNNNKAQLYFQKGFACSPDRVFPNRIEDVDILQKVVSINNNDYKAYYYLGNFCYAKKRYDEAKLFWESSIKINSGFSTAHRNLGIAYFNKFNLKKEALQEYETAFACDSSDARVLFELDQLYKRMGFSAASRLEKLKHNFKLVETRDDLFTEYVLLCTLSGFYSEAMQLITNRIFHPWEGGEGKVSGLYIQLSIELAKKALAENNTKLAIDLLEKAQTYPENLGEGKLYGAQENDIFYWLACCYEKLNDSSNAAKYFQKASVGLSEPTPAIFYNDQQPDKIYYQGEALMKLGLMAEAESRFNNLIKYGIDNCDLQIKMDFFAVSLPDLMIFDDDLTRRNNVHCNYLIGLGYLGLREFDIANTYFEKALAIDPSHLGIIIHQNLISQFRLSDAKV